MEKGSDYLFLSRDMSRPISPMGYPFVRNPNPEAHAKRKPYKQTEQPSSAAPFLTFQFDFSNPDCETVQGHLYRAYEEFRKAFINGFHYGAQLMLELQGN